MTAQTGLRQYPSEVIAGGLMPTRTTVGILTHWVPMQEPCDEQTRARVITISTERSGALNNTERPPQSTSGGIGGVFSGLAVAMVSTCICIGAGIPDPARQWHVSSTSLNFTDVSDARARRNAGVVAKANQVHQRLLTAKIGVQTREALAALGITKSQMAEILGIQRPHLYAWLADKVERAEKGDRLRDLLKILLDAGITSKQPLRSHLVTEPLEPSAQPLAAMLLGDLSSPALSSALATAHRLNRAIDDEIAQRESRMRAAGHNVGTDEEAQATLETTLTMMEWDRS